LAQSHLAQSHLAQSHLAQSDLAQSHLAQSNLAKRRHLAKMYWSHHLIKTPKPVMLPVI
jgi:hypothetical protein